MKKLVFLSLFLSSSVMAQTLNIQANQFAAEAGTIGGTVQACGQDITEYNSRVLDAINAITTVPSMRQQAMTTYETALGKAQEAQSRTHAINCSQGIQTFNALPLMQANYKQTVLPQLAKPIDATPPPTTTTQQLVTGTNNAS